MGLPGQMPPSSPHPGRGPFGEKGFRFALRLCLVLVVLGIVMMQVGGEAVSGVGLAILVLAVLGLVMGWLGLFAEQRILRRDRR